MGGFDRFHELLPSLHVPDRKRRGDQRRRIQWRFRECNIPDIWRAFACGIVGHPVFSHNLVVVNKFKTHRHFYTQCHIYINSLVY
ncbi:hypothetical protein DL764_003706 [Monosporascus ibericus]|uniref:Uncharacterized protein n=1 Tax=Monosporascus ibericus TaxID=155417 RepID=A0A4Q4TJZ2_9PEZI|nr:hypothetical protein DL764_003706 [Monosporascus ibericus]